MKSSYKLDEIGFFQLILLLGAPKPNCFLSPVPWIQNWNYHDFLHWKINTKAQLAAEMKSRFLATKIKLTFFHTGIKNGSEMEQEMLEKTWPAEIWDIMYPLLRQTWPFRQTIPSTILHWKTALCLVSFHPCMVAWVIPLSPKFVVAMNLPIFKDSIQITMSFCLAVKDAFEKMAMFIESDHSTLRQFISLNCTKRSEVGYKFSVSQRELNWTYLELNLGFKWQLARLILKILKLILPNPFHCRNKGSSKQ